MDGGNQSDPYVTCALSGTTVGDGKDKMVHKNKKQTDKVHFSQCFEFETVMPGASKLVVQVKDWNRYRKDGLIGESVIDLETRYFCDVKTPQTPVMTFSVLWSAALRHWFRVFRHGTSSENRRKSRLQTS